VHEYNKKFNHISQYGSYHADIDEKKMSLFRQGLGAVMRKHLTLFRGYTLNELLSGSMEQERKKRPLPGPNGGAPPMYRLVYTPPLGQPHGPPSSQQWSHRLPQQVAPCPPVYPRLAAPPRALQPARVGFPCFNYGQIGLFSHECPQPQQGFAARASPSLVSQAKAVVRPPSLRVGHAANFTTLEEMSLTLVWKFLLVHSFCMST
jgi:hypothetical protein